MVRGTRALRIPPALTFAMNQLSAVLQFRTELAANNDLFSNVQAGGYWSGIEFELDSNFAWFFYIGLGLQDPTVKDNYLFAWAVHDGDVGATPVPLPAAAFLLAPALGGLCFVRRRAS
jgi:hypothetical protein